jgi:ribulose 1,5-bisphosphate synthetase/thiazole synthase
MRCAGRERPDAGWNVAMIERAVVIAGGGPTGLTLAGELALAGVGVAIVWHGWETNPSWGSLTR